MVRPVRRVSALARSTISWKVSIGSRPSKAALPGLTSGSRSRARRVFSSARVKSSVNQPVMLWPSTTLVALRAANSGLAATSVVPPISFSWRISRAPSLLITRSGSMKSAPSSTARR